MSDLRERFRSLDRVPAPDLWRDIGRREPADVSLGPQWRRVAVAALAFVIAAAGMGVATWAFVANRDARRVDRPPIAAKRNGKIAFVGGKGQPFTVGLSDARIYDMDPDGSDIHFLAKGKEPAWSPDGTRVAYVKGGEFPWYELHVLDVSGTHDVRILLNKTQFIHGPSWSPDGQRMVVAIGGSNKGYDLYTLNADGSGLQRITSVTGSVGYPDWSPNGTRIVFTASDKPNSGLMNIYVVGATGTNLHRVTRTSHFQFSPVWSPDGDRIAFVDSQGQDHPSSINVMNADGTAEHSLFTCTGCLMDVAWSPDGTKLLFSRSQRSAWHVWTMDSDGTNMAQIDTGPFQAFWPAWQPIPG